MDPVQLLAALTGPAALLAAGATIYKTRTELKKVQAEASAASASASDSMAKAWRTTMNGLREELDGLRSELDALRAERGELVDELAALRTAVEEALTLLRPATGSHPSVGSAVTALETPKRRRAPKNKLRAKKSGGGA
jgi:chromosome segregation ATPase